MTRFSYYGAIIIHNGEWSVYLPDFNVVLSVGVECGDAYRIAYSYIYGKLDELYAEANTQGSHPIIPTASPLFDILTSTKRYLRSKELSIDNYFENMEIIVEYEPKST